MHTSFALGFKIAKPHCCMDNEKMKKTSRGVNDPSASCPWLLTIAAVKATLIWHTRQNHSRWPITLPELPATAARHHLICCPSTASCFCTFLRIPRHLLFLRHLPHCSRGVPIQEWSTLKTENSRTDPNTLNINWKAAAAAVTTISSFLLLNSTPCRRGAPTCRRSQRLPELRHHLPEGLAYLRHQIPVWQAQGTPRRQRTGGTTALGSGFR